MVVHGSALILPDVEVPFHEAHFVNQCIALARAHGIKQAIWAGDAIHNAALSPFPESEKDTAKEVGEVEGYLRELVDPFDTIYWFSGNHDRRPQRMLDRQIPLSLMARLYVNPEFAEEFGRKVKASDLFWCEVGTGENKWRITHPKSVNAIPASAAKAIAQSHNCNVAMAHDHQCGVQQTTDGRHWGIEIGCCCDPKRLEYVQTRDNTRPQMVNGALILLERNGTYYPHLLSPTLTDFAWEIKHGARQ
jgi:hypothetical protein